MATEKRLIDANKIKYHTVGAGGWGIPEEVACKSQIDRMPTVDAVEVVHCGACRHRHTRPNCAGRPMDFFCADGERNGR